MPDMIVFEELAPPAPETVDVAGNLALSCISVVADGATDIAFMSGNLALAMVAETGEAAGDPDVVVCSGAIQLLAGYIVAHEVEYPVVAANIPLEGESFAGGVDTVVEANLILGAQSVVGTGLIPVGDEPIQEITDGVLMGTALSSEQIIGLLSGLVGGDSLLSTMSHRITMTESLRLSDRLRILLEAVVTDQVAFASAVAGDALVTIAMVDTLRLTGVAEGTVSALATLSDNLALAAALQSVQETEVLDGVELAETLEGLVTAMESLVSAAVFAADVQALAVVTVVVPDALQASDTLEGVALYQAIIDERLAFSVGFTLDGVPYVGLAMNAATKGITEYDAYDYNSLAWFNGKLYGATATGLVRLEGASDDGAPIVATLRTAMQRIAGGKAARVSDAYIGFRGNGSLQLKVTVTQPTGERAGYVYDLVATPNAGGAPRTGRFKVGRGLKSVYMAFELGNVAGSDFAADVLEIRPLVLDRRLP